MGNDRRERYTQHTISIVWHLKGWVYTERVSWVPKLKMSTKVKVHIPSLMKVNFLHFINALPESENTFITSWTNDYSIFVMKNIPVMKGLTLWLYLYMQCLYCHPPLYDLLTTISTKLTLFSFSGRNISSVVMYNDIQVEFYVPRIERVK